MATATANPYYSQYKSMLSKSNSPGAINPGTYIPGVMNPGTYIPGVMGGASTGNVFSNIYPGYKPTPAPTSKPTTTTTTTTTKPTTSSKPPNISTTAGAPSISTVMSQAEAAMNEAKKKTEASKTSALGYYDSLKRLASQTMQAQQGYFQPVQQILDVNPDIISPEQQNAMLAQRRAALAAYGQNISGQLGDSDSGIAQGMRGENMRNIALQQANMPIDLQLEVGQANRASRLGLASAYAGQYADPMSRLAGDYYGNMAGIAGGQTGIQMGYDYDPGSSYYSALANAIGGMAGQNMNASGMPTSQMGYSTMSSGVPYSQTTTGTVNFAPGVSGSPYVNSYSSGGTWGTTYGAPRAVPIANTSTPWTNATSSYYNELLNRRY